MTIKVGINGMGRIGRMILRSIYENYKGKIVFKHILEYSRVNPDQIRAPKHNVYTKCVEHRIFSNKFI